MKKIALYGGSFDPPHLGHVMAIRTVLNAKVVDEVWVVPSGLNRDKVYHAPADDRKAMIAILLATMFGEKAPVYLNYSQMNCPWKVSATYELLLEMRKQYPKYAFQFVIGSDLVPDIPRWIRAKDLMKQKKLFLAVHRLGDPLPKKSPTYVQYIREREIALTNISSSLVRQMIQRGDSIDGVVPPLVMSHIVRNGLYKKALAKPAECEVLAEGQYLRFIRTKGWEYVKRSNCTGVAIIVALTKDQKLLFTEQHRVPVGSQVIEFPAGLVNDQAHLPEETIIQSAHRELLEETGYKAERMSILCEGPVSSGMTPEIVTFLFAQNLKKIHTGGGVDGENIRVHAVPLDQVDCWLNKRAQSGQWIDPKVYTGLYFLRYKKI